MITYPPPRATRSTSGPSSVRSRDTYDRNVFAAPGGGQPRHTSSTSRPAGTTRPASSSSNASTARCFGPPSATSRPALTRLHRAEQPDFEHRSPTGRRLAIR